MAIFKCVGYFYFHIPEGICFTGFFCMWSHFKRFHFHSIKKEKHKWKQPHAKKGKKPAIQIPSGM
jgi:hypothetical protein